MINRILADLIFLIKLKHMQKYETLSTPNIKHQYQLNRSLTSEIQRLKMPLKYQLITPKKKSHSQIMLKSKLQNFKSAQTKKTTSMIQKSLDGSISLKYQFDNHKISQSEVKFQKKVKINFGRQEKLTLYLSPELQKFSDKHKLREQKPQIKYVNTLKKLKQTGKALGCSVRAKSEGIQLQLSNDMELKVNDQLRFTFRKQFDRLLRKKLIKQSNNCRQQAFSFNSILQQDRKQISDCLNINEKDRQYKQFDVSRFESYLKGKATQPSKYSYYIKKAVEQKLKNVQLEQKLEEQKSQESESLWDTKRNTLYSNNLTLSRKVSYSEDIQSPTSSPKHGNTFKIDQYKEDLIQFLQICQFYKKIQHELLRYLPNNHISNKINTVISQVQHGIVIKKIYGKCDTDIMQITPIKIVAILKRYPGILSTMNYIVNIIKLNISAERRKRFIDIQKTIGKFQSIIADRKGLVYEKLKKIDNPQLKNSIQKSLLKTKVECYGLNPSYIQFVKQGEKQQFSQLSTFKNRRTICQILKFESLMK